MADPWQARQTAVLVPTFAAGAQLRRTIENQMVDGATGPVVRVMPFLLTRAGWYREMHAGIEDAPRFLTPIARHVCMLAAARGAKEGESPPPFNLRPGLVPSIIEFYDQLMCHRRSVDAFERLLITELEPSIVLDRGARRLLRQTIFLVSTFRRYERRLAEAGCVDEHGVRQLLINAGSSTSFRRVVLTVPDHVVDPAGLWPVDYDLLTRLPGLAEIDIVATERVLGAGFYERITDRLPGLSEERVGAGDESLPCLISPGDAERPYFVWRDREEELLAVARAVKDGRHRPVKAQHPARSGAEGSVPPQIGVVFRRRLPYLYLARQLFGQAGVPYETWDALPLAAEPYAAALDLVCSFVASQYDRTSTIALLHSPHFSFDLDGRRLDLASVEGLDRTMREVGFSGGRRMLDRLAASLGESDQTDQSTDARVTLAGVARLAARLSDELSALDSEAPPSRLLETLAAFLRRHTSERPPPEPICEREHRARTAVWAAVEELAGAHQELDDTEVSFAEVVAMLRRWIESQTFEPRAGAGGVQLVDAQTAPYGRFHDLFIIGMVDGEWPERLGRNVFYPSSLLIPLGWPRERDLFRAARAAFGDLVGLPIDHVWLSTVSLEDDAIVTPSIFLEDVGDLVSSALPATIDETVSVTYEDAIAYSSVHPGDIPEPTSTWLAVRQIDRNWLAPQYRGFVGSRDPAPYAVRSLERYLECPFRYFADRVLKLSVASSDERVTAPQRRGLFLHQVFETFFRTWHDEGNRAITVTNLGRALPAFSVLAQAAIAALPAADQAITRSWMLGSAAAPGLADRLFALEVSRPTDVVERLTEFRIDGEFVMGSGADLRKVRLRGVADRVDLYSDGTFSIIDYKMNRAPERSLSLQLPLYARCLEQQLSERDGRPWRAVEAAFVAFGEPRLAVRFGAGDLAKERDRGERQALRVLHRIEQGEYPVEPAQPYRCGTCPYPSVCRKDYVGGE